MKAIIYPTQGSSESRVPLTVISGEIPFLFPLFVPNISKQVSRKSAGFKQPSFPSLTLYSCSFSPFLHPPLESLFTGDYFYDVT